MKNLLIPVLLLISITCVAQSFSRNDFSLISVPVTPDIAGKLNSSGKFFSVSIKNNQLEISKFLSSAIRTCPAKSGKILAVELGEWGGGIYFEPTAPSVTNYFVNGKSVDPTSKLKSYLTFLVGHDSSKKLLGGVQLLIASGNSASIVPYKNDWLFIQGPVGHKDNWLCQLKMQQDSFTVIKLIALDAIPRAMAVYSDHIYVVTESSFYKISAHFNIEVYMSNLFQRGIEPNSIAVVNDEEIYLGANAGYYQFNNSNKKLFFFKYRGLN